MPTRWPRTLVPIEQYLILAPFCERRVNQLEHCSAALFQPPHLVLLEIPAQGFLELTLIERSLAIDPHTNSDGGSGQSGDVIAIDD